MKQQVYLNEESLQRLVENCVYNMLNEDMDEGFWGGISNVAKQGWNKLKNAYQDGSYNQDFKKAVAQCRKYQQAINNLKKTYNIPNTVINSNEDYIIPARGSKGRAKLANSKKKPKTKTPVNTEAGTGAGQKVKQNGNTTQNPQLSLNFDNTSNANNNNNNNNNNDTWAWNNNKNSMEDFMESKNRRNSNRLLESNSLDRTIRNSIRKSLRY